MPYVERFSSYPNVSQNRLISQIRNIVLGNKKARRPSSHAGFLFYESRCSCGGSVGIDFTRSNNSVPVPFPPSVW